MGYESQKPHTKQMHALVFMNSAISNAAAQRNKINLFERFYLLFSHQRSFFIGKTTVSFRCFFLTRTALRKDEYAVKWSQ